jgi:hypothetical protein
MPNALPNTPTTQQAARKKRVQQPEEIFFLFGIDSGISEHRTAITSTAQALRRLCAKPFNHLLRNRSLGGLFSSLSFFSISEGSEQRAL